jgi:SAM-dependent methyltransferase
VPEQERLHRRVAGWHDIRLDGLTDLLLRAPGASVLDVGCNRGLVGFEFAANGATVVHGCDNYAEGIQAARHLFCDLRGVSSQFEAVDLTQGPRALQPFQQDYTMVLVLATVHKLARSMPETMLCQLVRALGERAERYVAWRATSEKAQQNELEMSMMDRELRAIGLARVHTSYLSQELGVAAIWRRG